MPDQPFTRLRTYRRARRWSQTQAVAAMRCQTHRRLPEDMTLLRQWKRWESGAVTPSQFYQQIIASALCAPPEAVFPPPTRTPGALGNASQLRNDLESRREHVMRMLSALQAELDYLDAVLAVPSPLEAGILTA